MREETKRQIREFYAKTSRFSGAVIALIALWYAGLFVTRLLTQKPAGEALLVMLFAGLMAAALLGVRAENPHKSNSKKPD